MDKQEFLRFENLLSDSEWLKKTYRDGRTFKKNSFPPDSPNHNESNACAATASERLMKAGIIGRHFLLAEDLAKHMRNLGWIRVNSVSEVQKGDLIVTQDLNKNKLADHVFFATSGILEGPPSNKCMGVDNTHYGVEYLRNLGKGNYTPMDYILRHPFATAVVSNKTQDITDKKTAEKILSNISELYTSLGVLGVSDEAIHLLNDLRYHPEIDKIIRVAKSET